MLAFVGKCVRYYNTEYIELPAHIVEMDLENKERR